MRRNYILQAFFSTAIILCFCACGDHSKNNTAAGSDTGKTAASQPAASTNTNTTAQPVYKKPSPAESKFKELRIDAFTITPHDLKTSAPVSEDVVYGVIFDQENNGEITTLATYQNGDIALYLSTGSVKKLKGSEAPKFVALAQTYLDKATKAHDTFVPAKGMVKFYLLTNKGIYVADESVKNLTAHTSAWAAIYDEGNKIIKQAKLAAGK